MTDRKIEYTLKTKYEGSGEIGKLRSDLNALGKIESIKRLGKDVRDLTVRFNEAKKKVIDQAREMRRADEVTKEMTSSYKASQKEVRRLAAALEKKKAAFRESSAAARNAGVNTKQLTTEEKRLTTASKETGKVWAARRALGVKSHQDIKVEVLQLRKAYDDLKKSGKASALELYQAKHKLNTKTRELVASTTGWAASVEKVRVGVVALAGAGYGMMRVFTEFSAFESGIAEVNTLLDVSKERFAEFKAETKDVVGDLPQQSRDLTKSLYDIISAGVALEDSSKTLELSGKAATAGITETKTAVNAGVGAINAYGEGIDKLEGYYDILFQTVKSGVTTFPELSEHIGDVLPTARAAGVEFEEVGAAIAALTKAGIKTPKAATSLNGAIRAMAAPAPEARAKFEELGITWDGLLPTLEAIAERGLSIDQMRLLIPDVEASTGVLSLTQNLDEFRSILGSMDDAGGSMQEAYDKMADTPDHEIKMMMKSVHDLGVSVGELASVVILPAAKTIGFLAGQVNEMPGPVKGLVSLIGAAVTAGIVWNLGLSTIIANLTGMVVKVGESRVAVALYTTTVNKASVGLKALRAAMLANPMTAAFTGLVLAAAAAWALFGKNSLDASKDHAEAARKIGKGREEIDREIDSLEKLRETFNKANPGSAEYLKAERELAELLPDANLALDEQGRIIAKVGDEASENSRKLNEYIQVLKEESRLTLALQLEQQAKAYEKANEALGGYKENLRNWYGIGDKSSGPIQALWRGVNRLTGTYDKNIQKGEEVRNNLREQEREYDKLLRSMVSAGMSADELGTALDDMHMSAELKQSIIARYEKLTSSIEDVTESAEDSASLQKDVFGEATEDIKKQYVKLAQEVRRILEDIANRQKELSAELREMARSGMDDYSAWKDLKQEADEYYQAAQEAASAGSFEEAVRLADEARQKYKDLNTEVKEGDKVVVSQSEALEEAMAGVKKSGELAIEILKEQEQVAKDNAAALEQTAGEFSKGWSDAWDAFVKDGKQAVSDMESALDSLTKDRTVKVNVVEGKSNGGILGLKMHLGGLVQRLATGGSVGFRNGLNGLRLPGYGGGDRRWILGEDGEVMIRKEAVKLAGVRTALAFNQGDWGTVVSELTSRFGLSVGDVVKRRFGGIIEAVNSVSIPTQRLSGGGAVVAPSAAIPTGLHVGNITINYSGTGSANDARKITDMVLANLEQRWVGASK